MKLCQECKIEKPKTEFWKNSKAKDGLQVYCKSCLTKQQKKYRKLHPERFRESQKKYWDKHIDRKREINRASYNRFRTAKSEIIKNRDKIAGISPLLDEIINFWVSNLNKSNPKK